MRGGYSLEKEVIVVKKHAETSKNRVIVPMSFVRKVGREFNMEIHEDYIVLKSLKDKSIYVKKEN